MTDFRNFFTAIYNNELRNKNLLKFSPHLKSVAALPCETWNVKCTTVQHLIYNLWNSPNHLIFVHCDKLVGVLNNILLTYFSDYYREVLLDNELKEKLLPCIKEISGDNFIFQQNSAPAHSARDTMALLCRETPDFISPDQWPPNSPYVNPVDYKIWAVMQEWVYEKRVNDVDELCQRLLSVCGSALDKTS